MRRSILSIIFLLVTQFTHGSPVTFEFSGPVKVRESDPRAKYDGVQIDDLMSLESAFSLRI